MGDPELHSDESIILTTPDVFVKSIPFEAILTNKRIILVDRKKNLIPPKDILLATIRDVEPGENAIRDQIITLSIITTTGDTRQMVLTFPRQAGGGRKRERDAWVKALREHTSSTFQKAIRRVIPAFDLEQKKHVPETTTPRIEITGRPTVKKEIEGAYPIKKIVETSHAPPKPVEATSLPYGSFCSRCGNRVPPESMFCNRCGAKIVLPGETVAAEPAARPAPTTASVAVVPTTERKERPIEQEIRSIEPLIEGSVPRTEPAPIVPPQSPTTPTAGPAVRQPAPRAPAAAQPKPARRSIFPQIFPRKDLPQQPAKPAAGAPPVSPPPREGSGKSRRTIIAIAAIIIIIIAIAGGAFVYMKYLRGIPAEQGGPGGAPPATTPGGSARPTTAAPVTISRPEPTPATVPSAGVWVRIDYIGGWKGSYGIAGALQPVTDSGERLYEIENANGTVQASFLKLDGSAHELVVEIYRNGAPIKHGSTSAPQGNVDLSVDTKTATPISTTAAATTTATQLAVNTTATPTTKPTTPAANVTTTHT